MSERNLEIVRALVRGFAERDEEVVSYFDPDVIMHAPEGWPEPGPMIGREAVIGQFARLGADWRDLAMTIERAEPGPGHVVVHLHWEARGAASELAFQIDLSGVYFFRDGVVHELAFFRTWDEAAAAADRGPSR